MVAVEGCEISHLSATANETKLVDAKCLVSARGKTVVKPGLVFVEASIVDFKVKFFINYHSKI